VNYTISITDGSASVYEATEGTLVTINSSEKEGHTFAGWLDENGNVVSTDTEYTFEMPEKNVSFSASYVANSNWRTDDIGKYYVIGNSYAKSQWMEIDGKKYRFDDKGYALISKWFKENNQWYYLDEEGIMVTGWKKINKVWYYMNQDGIMQTGWQKIDNQWYYLNASGAMKTGWHLSKNIWYYLMPNGTMATGWKKINGKWYYFLDYGGMATGWKKVNNVWYYLDPANGDMKTGWLELEQKNSTQKLKYYLDASGAMKTGWNEIDGKNYHFNPSGALSRGWEKIKTDDKENWYYFEEGMYVTGWRISKNYWYYMNKDGIMQTGWQLIKGVQYYLQPSGIMQTGWLKQTDKETKKVIWYYFDANGAMKTGWQKINNKWYYLNDKGVMQTGMLTLGNKQYYLEASGAMATGWKKLKLDDTGEKWYYFSGSGAMLKGLQKINNKWYYLDPQDGVMFVGMIKLGTISYEFGSDGALASLVHNDVAYYAQTDSRWGNIQLGEYKPIKNTGCVPTTATAVVNYLTGTNYTPKDLATKFYEWGDYNSHNHGTDSTVWRKFANHYGLTFHNNMTYNQIINALKDGKVCVAAMGNGYFATEYYTHEVCFFGIDSIGRTFVYDPLDKNKNGRYSVREMCNQLSEDFVDLLDGGPVYSFASKAGAPKGSADSSAPAQTTLGKIEVINGPINIRKGAGTSYSTDGQAAVGKVYEVYEKKTADGFTWYRIGTDRWIADNGSWVKFTAY